MKLTLEEHNLSKKFLLDYVINNKSSKLFKVRKYNYASIPTQSGPVKFKPNDVFKFNYENGLIVSFEHNGSNYVPTWTQMKLEDWITDRLTTRL